VGCVDKKKKRITKRTRCQTNRNASKSRGVKQALEQNTLPCPRTEWWCIPAAEDLDQKIKTAAKAKHARKSEKHPPNNQIGHVKDPWFRK
jgi:hypothetical protein